MNNGVASIFLLILFLIFSSHPSFAKDPKKELIKIAILDSGFCPELLSLDPKIKIRENWFATEKKIPSQCAQYKDGDIRFHGQKVLEAFLEYWTQQSSNINIEITPIVMLDEHGFQSKESWFQAIKKLRDEKYTLVISSIGFAIEKASKMRNEKWTLPNEPTYFLAAGEKVGRLANVDLFPQFLATRLNKKTNLKIHLVGVNHRSQTFYSSSVTNWLISEDSSISASIATPQLAAQWLLKKFNP